MPHKVPHRVPVSPTESLWPPHISCSVGSGVGTRAGTPCPEHPTNPSLRILQDIMESQNGLGWKALRGHHSPSTPKLCPQVPHPLNWTLPGMASGA